MKRCHISDLLREVASAPPVHREPIQRQETIVALPGEFEGGPLPPMPPPILLENEASLLETPPRSSADDQPTVEAPAWYTERVVEMDARAAQDARDEEIAKLQRRMLRLERVLHAILPSLLLIPGLPMKRRKVLTQAMQLLEEGAGGEVAPESRHRWSARKDQPLREFS